MPYVPIQAFSRENLLETAERRWRDHPRGRPGPGAGAGAAAAAAEPGRSSSRTAIAGGRLPRLSLPPKYVAAKLDARRAGAGRRADSGAGRGADAGAAPAVRRARRAAAPARPRPTSANAMEGGKLEAGVAADRVAAPRPGGACAPAPCIAACRRIWCGWSPSSRSARSPTRCSGCSSITPRPRELRDGARRAGITATVRRAARGRRSPRSSAAIARCAARSARARGS